MAVFQRLTKEQINKDYDYYGLMFGLVPIYVGDPEGDCRVCVRNWWPEWTLDLVEAMAGVVDMAMSAVDPHHEPMFAIKITGEIKQG